VEVSGIISKSIIEGFTEEDFFNQLARFEFAVDMKQYMHRILTNLIKLVHDSKNDSNYRFI
jgi:hypothetical protein